MKPNILTKRNELHVLHKSVVWDLSHAWSVWNSGKFENLIMCNKTQGNGKTPTKEVQHMQKWLHHKYYKLTHML